MLIYDIKYEIVKLCELSDLLVLRDVSREFREIVDKKLKCYVCSIFTTDVQECDYCEQYICTKCEQGDDLCKKCMGDCEFCDKERNASLYCEDCDKNICNGCVGFICECGPRCYDCRVDLVYAYCQICSNCTCSECEEDERYSFDCEKCGILVCTDCSEYYECHVCGIICCDDCDCTHV